MIVTLKQAFRKSRSMLIKKGG